MKKILAGLCLFASVNAMADCTVYLENSKLESQFSLISETLNEKGYQLVDEQDGARFELDLWERCEDGIARNNGSICTEYYVSSKLTETSNLDNDQELARLTYRTLRVIPRNGGDQTVGTYPSRGIIGAGKSKLMFSTLSSIFFDGGEADYTKATAEAMKNIPACDKFEEAITEVESALIKKGQTVIEQRNLFEYHKVKSITKDGFYILTDGNKYSKDELQLPLSEKLLN